VNEEFAQFKRDYRRAFDMSDSFDLFGSNPNKHIRILPSELPDPQTKQAPDSQGNKPPP
jgi:hypothetical protein